MAKEEIDAYLNLIKEFNLARTDLEKREIGKRMVKFLRSESVSTSRSAKYKLRKWFGELAPGSKWGPPEEGEILWWEKYFQN